MTRQFTRQAGGAEPRAGTAVGDLVHELAALLERAGIPDARAEARDMVAIVTGQSRFWPSAHSDAAVADRVVDLARTVAARRASGMPFAYAVGCAPFRHLTLRVDERVLIPRQETEVLVDLVLRHGPPTEAGGTVADVCTGSGAIALALADEWRYDLIIATDVAADAIELARENAAQLNARESTPIEFRVGDLLAPLRSERLDVLVANPPYIAFDEIADLPRSVRDWEPVHALLSAANGLDATRRIIRGADRLVSSGGLLALEVDARRALQVAELLSASGAWSDVRVHLDLAGRDRFVLATRA